MAQPYVGEIRMFAGNFPPLGWLFCDGTLLSIAENEILFQVIGTIYGGDGQNNFAIPNLIGRAPVHQGNGFQCGELGGVESVTLTVNQIPSHNHTMLASLDNANATAASNNLLASTTAATIDAYGTDAPLATLSANTITTVGGNQPHDNMQPYLGLNFIISLYGLFPSQT